MQTQPAPALVAATCLLLSCMGMECAGAEDVLEEVMVWGRIPSESSSAIKSPAPLRELPFSVEVIPADIINAAQLHSLSRLLDLQTLGTTSSGDGGLFEEVALRGFADAPFYRDGLNDASGNLPIRDMANVESIEVLKGPHSAIHGPGEPGGSINIETKKPQWRPFNSVVLGLGNYNRYRAEIDSTGPVAGSDAIAYRLVGALEDSGSLRDFVDLEKIFIAPSAGWKPSDRLTLLADLEYIRQEAPFDSGVVAIDGAFPLPRERFLGEPEIGNVRIKGLTSTLNGEVEFDDGWTVSATVYWQNTAVDGLKIESDELDDVDLADPTATLSRELQDESISTQSLSTQVELEGEFDFGDTSNRVLAGYEFSTSEEKVSLAGSDVEDEPYEIDIFDLEYGQDRPDLSPLRDSTESVDVHSLYIQDFLKFGEQWRVLAGTRLDFLGLDGNDRVSASRFDHDDSKFSSRLGIVFAPVSAFSLFASYSESLDPNEGLQPSGDPLKPSRGKAIEAGLKAGLPLMDLSFDASVFRIKQTNVAADAPDDPGFEIQTASQISEGLDLALFFRPIEAARLGIKYEYNNARISGDPEVADGTTPLNAPLHKLIVFGLFSFSVRRDHDLRTGINFVHASERQASLDPEETFVKLPGYSTVNLFANYRFSPQVDFAIDVNNVFGEDYFAASQSDLVHIVPGPPVTVFGSIRIHF